MDDIKTPKCPDFEQFFTKTKKGEVKKGEIRLGKKDDDKRKPPIQPPIFGDKTTSARPPFAEKKTPATPIMNGGNLFPKKISSVTDKQPTTSQPSAEKTKPPTVSKSEAPAKKDSVTKSLNDFTQFTMPPRSFDTKSVDTQLTQKKESIPPPQSQPIDDSKTGEENLLLATENTDGRSKNHIWLAVAAGICAIGSVRISNLRS